MINNKVKYGLKALIYLSNRGMHSITSAAQISEELEIPKEFTSKILQSLTKYGYVESRKGKGGGFGLSQDPYEIKISDLFTSLGNSFDDQVCLFQINKSCKGENCRLCNEWNSFNEKFKALIKEYTVGSFSCLL